MNLKIFISECRPKHKSNNRKKDLNHYFNQIADIFHSSLHASDVRRTMLNLDKTEMKN